MPRLPLVDPDDPATDPHARALLERVQQLRGRTLNVYRAIGNHPDVLEGVLAFGRAAYFENSLTPAQRELAYLGASVANDCHYWIPTHVVAGRATGLTEEKLAAIGADPLPDGLYAPDEAAIVRYAQVSSRLEPVTDELYAALAANFTDKQIIEICFTVGMSNMINRFHATFHTDVDDSTAELLGAVCPVPLPPRPDDA